ncbi:FAD-dependent oxidoreductase [Azoarcus sp. DN11]|uniref:FAD-dependent oxidoreductase n=1 Tax=Azoarcus sp. DN11 TaxID=356837 RepID=UPI000EB35ED4|nr:FAD-dependent oxidoreductase [Azoarcus sp. DN11]AYH44987.1 pyridine nucleotide-disulfide oxidoreductase [Azoarcus sp. DN11]
MTKNFDFVVVGGGLAGATAVETLRTEGAKGSILLLAAEPHLPYHRPPLSKSALTAEQAPPPTLVLSKDQYRELGVELLLGTPVSAIDPAGQMVHTRPGADIHYKRLLIATGASPRRLSLPGAALPGVFYLRSLEDAEAIRGGAQTARRAVVIGGSFIGLEAAASLRQKGIEVTLLERSELLGKLHMPEVSAFFRRGFAKHGVEVIVGDSPAAIRGKTAVEAVVTQGGRTVACDMVVIGAGVAPETGFLEGSGIAVDNGIVVDRFLRTSQPGVFAAGDVANFFDPIFSRQRRVEHWDNAIRQGRIAARNMLDQRVSYDEVTYFYSEMFDLSFNLLGQFEAGDEKIERGSLQSRSFASFFLRHDVPRALFSFGRPTEEMKVTELLIKNRVNLKSSRARLSDPDYTLCHIPNQTIYILQGGGAFGAFECGAVRALEESDVRPDVVAGVSIGAFNGAIIAGNPDHAAAALTAFWNDLATATPALPDENLRRQIACGQIALFGVPQFFQPRWFLPMLSPEQLPNRWFSLYDTAPAVKLLEKYVDFSKLRSSPTRLMVSAVDVQTSELVVFDSYVDDLTPAHIIASGSLPLGFPWTTIDGKHYWDGGIVSNSPLDLVVQRCGSAGKRVFIIDLFPGKRNAMPANLVEAMARQSEILYCERVRSDLSTRELVNDFRRLVDEIVAELPAATAERIRHRPRFIALMGEDAPMTITRIIREDSEDEPSSKDYDFSRLTIDQLIESGYGMTRKALGL